jgi:hypothetical protein
MLNEWTRAPPDLLKTDPDAGRRGSGVVEHSELVWQAIGSRPPNQAPFR